MTFQLRLSYSSCKYLYALIEDILDLTCLESDTLVLNMDWVNTKEMIDEVIEILSF